MFYIDISLCTSDPNAQFNNGGHQFRFCPSLTKVFFSNPNCAWRGIFLTRAQGDQSNYFADSVSLVEVYLPRDFNLQYEAYTGSSDATRPDSTCWNSNASLKFYVYHTVYDLVASPAISDFWHRTAGNAVAPIVFYCGTNADIITGSAGNYSEKRQGTVYWTIYNGTPVYLGTASVDSSTGLVTFQTSGYTANSSGVSHS